MRIGFDLDGVLAKTDIPLFRVADMSLDKEKRRDVYNWKFKLSETLLNPIDLILFEEDEYYIITSRDSVSREITERWVKMYCPHCKELIMLDSGLPDKNASVEEVMAWVERMADDKAKVINERKIEVYFEDSPTIVRKLRKLCPNTKIIQYGGRI